MPKSIPMAMMVFAAAIALARPLSAEQTEVVVVGGGIAGLAAAAYLSEDYDVVVLEKETRAGGRAVSGRHRGWTYAKGTEYLGRPDGALEEILEELELEPTEIPAPMDAHYYGGRLHIGEAAIARLYADLGGIEALNRFAAAVRALAPKYRELPRFRPGGPMARLDGITARRWLGELKLPKIFHDRLNVAARGLFGASLDEMSALAILPEAAFDFGDWEPIEDIDDLDVPGDSSSGSYSFPGGVVEITDALAKALGPAVRFGATATRVTRDGDDVLVDYLDDDSRRHRIEADAVVLAVPAPVALRIGKRVLDQEQRNILKKIPYAPYATVALFSDTPIFDKAFDLAVPDGWFFTDIYDATWVQRKTGKRGAGAVMGVYVGPKSVNDGLLKLPDHEIVNRVLKDLERLFPGARDRITGWDLHRHRYAYPVMTPGAHGRLAKLWKTIKGPVFLAGDYMIYPTFEAAAESGKLAAEMAGAYMDD